jgi:hypothetical protein
MSLAERLQPIEGEIKPGETLTIPQVGKALEVSVGSLCVSVNRGLVRKWPLAVKFERMSGVSAAEGEPEGDVDMFDSVVGTGKLPGIIFAKDDGMKTWLIEERVNSCRNLTSRHRTL